MLNNNLSYSININCAGGDCRWNTFQTEGRVKFESSRVWAICSILKNKSCINIWIHKFEVQAKGLKIPTGNLSKQLPSELPNLLLSCQSPSPKDCVKHYWNAGDCHIQVSLFPALLQLLHHKAQICHIFLLFGVPLGDPMSVCDQLQLLNDWNG